MKNSRSFFTEKKDLEYEKDATKTIAENNRVGKEDTAPLDDSRAVERIEFIDTLLEAGDKIGQYYEVYDILGIGGNGVVYLAYSNLSKNFIALKTYLDRSFLDEEIKKRFTKEASVWIKLDSHPNLVKAYVVEEILGRLYISMEYIRSDSKGINTLEGFLKKYFLTPKQILDWAIQFCRGIEFAYSHGVKCHGDIKPSNIMITPDKTLKITDFGLASVFHGSHSPKAPISSDDEISRRTKIFGTPTHMSPELYSRTRACDERSDIYSFGIVLYQMASGGRMPFLAPYPTDNSNEEKLRYWREMEKLHTEMPVPELDSPVYPIIRKCLDKCPANRYQHFHEIHHDLEVLLWDSMGEVHNVESESAIENPLEESVRLGNKALSCYSINLLDDAVAYCDKSLEIEPRNVFSLNIKGLCCVKQRNFSDAIRWFDKANDIAPEYSEAWNNKGGCYKEIGDIENAFRCFKKATEIKPSYSEAWANQGYYFVQLRKYNEAIECYNSAIRASPQNPEYYSAKGCCLEESDRLEEALHCYNLAIEYGKDNVIYYAQKGQVLYKWGDFEDAISCYDIALSISPGDPMLWNNKGLCFTAIHEFDSAHRCFSKALELDPDNATYYNNNGICFHRQGLFNEALNCFDSAIKLKADFSEAWGNMGLSYDALGKYPSALRCYNEAIRIQPLKTDFWVNKGATLNSLERYDDAVLCFDRALEIDPYSDTAKYNRSLSQAKIRSPSYEDDAGDRKVTPSFGGFLRRMVFFFDSHSPPYYEQKTIDDLIDFFQLKARVDSTTRISTEYGPVPAIPQYYSSKTVPDDLLDFIRNYVATRWAMTDQISVGQIRLYCFKVNDVWGVLVTSEL
jgi:tetratricopeptide (TPR) repeat protein